MDGTSSVETEVGASDGDDGGEGTESSITTLAAGNTSTVFETAVTSGCTATVDVDDGDGLLVAPAVVFVAS